MWQDSTINREAARNTSKYSRVGRVSPADTSGTVVTSETLDIGLTAESGFYKAVVDLSTCILIERILVFYYVCPAVHTLTRTCNIQLRAVHNKKVNNRLYMYMYMYIHV